MNLLILTPPRVADPTPAIDPRLARLVALQELYDGTGAHVPEGGEFTEPEIRAAWLVHIGYARRATISQE